MSVRIVLADDQRIVREGLASLLGSVPDLDVVGVAASGEEALALLDELTPDVLLTDLRMPGIGGVEAIRRARGRVPAVALTTFEDADTVREALQAGALGFLNKDADAEAIAAALRAAATGRSLLDPAALTVLLGGSSSARDEQPATSEAGLTPREVTTLVLVAKGLSNGQIARELVLGTSTVKTHVNHLLAKTGCRDRAALVAWAYAHDVRPPQ